MSATYNFNELNIEKTFEDAIEINEKRYKLIKEIKLKDVDIFENVLQNKGITYYYFIKTDNKNIGIFVSYLQFDKMLGFLEDELLKIKRELKEYKYSHYRQVKNREDIKTITVSSVRKNRVVLQNFEDISKTEVIGKVLKKFFLLYHG